MIQGKICGSLISHELGYINEAKHTANVELYNQSLSSLRQGMFSPANKGRTDLAQTDEGYALSKSLLEKGYLTSEELKAFPAAKKPEGMFPVIECTQTIPCDPCQEVCPGKCIEVGSNITLLPKINPKNKCTGCALCVANCPGQAIFLIKELKEENCGIVALPYEFLPMPKKGAKGIALNRSGKKVCEAEVVEVRSAKTMDRTAIVFMKVPADQINEARFFKPAQEVC
jgi:Fe-S-cluster-containing hydrogenase component 2